PGGIEEAGGDRLALQQLADARHGLAVAVLALADAHRAFVAVAQRDRLMVGIEADRHGAARAIRPRLRLQTAAGAGPVDDAAPLRLGPLPGLLLRRGMVVHEERSACIGGRMVRGIAAVGNAPPTLTIVSLHQFAR